MYNKKLFLETLKNLNETPKMKKGGTKKFSSNLAATNRLFKKNPLFKKNALSKPNSLFKKPNYKKKTYDPQAMYFAYGGENDISIPALNHFDEDVQFGKYGVEVTKLKKFTKGGGQTIAVGEIYKYSGRPDSEYKMNENGQWTIKNASTNNKFVPIKDPTGSRSAELERNAISENDFFVEQNKRNKQLLKEIENPKSFITLEDPRTIRATSGQKINPNVDLVSGKYNEEVIKKIIKKAKAVGVDPATAIAIALQESRIGQTDLSLGHLLHGKTGNPYEYIDFYKQKLNEAKRAKINDELLQIQYYNGLGTVTPKTEKGYHGYEMQKIYGVPIPASGINMRKNPLYGKQIVDIRDNVIKRNKQIQKYLKDYKSGGVVAELSKKEIDDLIAQGYRIEKL